MKVSIITVCKNSVDTIEDTIRSVEAQTYKNIEYIVIDGQSNDGTIAIINEKIHLISKFISESDGGLYDAMNKGLSYATGDIVGIINSDDLFAHSRVIETVVNAFIKHDPDCVYGDLVYVDRNNPKKISRRWKAGTYTPKKFYYGWMPPHPTFFVKRYLYEKAGHFDTKFRIAADYELMLRMLIKYNANSYYIPEILTLMRQGGTSNRDIKNRIISFKENLEAWKSNDLSPYFFTIYLKIFRKIFQFSNPLHSTYS